MENKINIAEILRDCPKGMELYSPLCGECKLYDVNDYNIRIEASNKDTLICLYHDGRYCANGEIMLFPKGKTTWEGFVPPCKFKDGDILVHTQNDRFIMSIYKSNKNEQLINTHAILWDREEGLSVGMQICCYTDNVRLATEEEKEKLFDAIKAHGYKWNSETKTLEKLIKPEFKVGDRVRHKVVNKNDVHEINRVYDDSYGFVGFPYTIPMKYQDKYELVPNKFDITNLKPFDKVLVRDDDKDMWCASIFSHTWKDKYFCIGAWHNQCIPYEAYKELLGTTNNPKEHGDD